MDERIQQAYYMLDSALKVDLARSRPNYDRALYLKESSRSIKENILSAFDEIDQKGNISSVVVRIKEALIKYNDRVRSLLADRILISDETRRETYKLLGSIYIDEEWEQNFSSYSTARTYLMKLYNDICMIELDAARGLYRDIHYYDYQFDLLELHTLNSDTQVKAGQPAEVRFVIAASNSTVRPKVVVGEFDYEAEQLKAGYDSVSVAFLGKTKLEYRFTPTAPGVYEKDIVAIVNLRGRGPIYIPYKFKYTVTP